MRPADADIFKVQILLGNLHLFYCLLTESILEFFVESDKIKGVNL